jgi:hypothetical protein
VINTQSELETSTRLKTLFPLLKIGDRQEKSGSGKTSLSSSRNSPQASRTSSGNTTPRNIDARGVKGAAVEEAEGEVEAVARALNTGKAYTSGAVEEEGSVSQIRG